ncbi:M15 family metallopeptidase [Cellulomonas sp. KRMCY2]|uniref:M15 family metallopeptidase n=1 Tax=Cellulomonas sp. KRMCY2 TaxID=1304865 RepID=UPI00045E9287|nr:M15 family metallopeptidase [Cellulomonas sp. KRMCY2]
MTTRPQTPRRPARRRRLSTTLLVLLVVAAAWHASGPLLRAAGLDIRAVGGTGASPGTPSAATGLDPELQRRFDVAQEAAAAENVTLRITSGWRSTTEQQALLDGAVERYGSLAEASRWVLPPEDSAHVQGQAIDVGDTEGALWLGEHSLEFGLCRTYANEMWHFEMLTDGATACPEPSVDPSGG